MSSTDAEVEARRILLSDSRRALLERRLRGPLLQKDDPNRIRPRLGDSSKAPVSFSQQRLWFLELLDGELAMHNLRTCRRLRGELDEEALRRALETIVHRHEPLRTTFLLIDDQPMQVIQRPTRFELRTVDVRGFSDEFKETEVAADVGREGSRRFDLTCDLMLRASLLQLGEEEHVLNIVMHHIASDGWSLGILWRELATLYGAYRNGRESPLAPLAIQYADYAVWQSKQLQGERRERLLGYWREQLKGVGTLELRTDRPRPSRMSYRAERQPFELGGVLSDRLRELSRAEGVTLHMTLVAAFQTLLMRYTGQHDISLGVPVAGRKHPDLENLIGCFVNTLVLRSDFSGNPTFREVLRRVRQVSLDAYDHQDLPFEKLVEEIQPERQLNRTPLCQVLFQLLDFPSEPPELPGLDVSTYLSTGERVGFDLEIHLWDRSGSLHGTIAFSTDLFAADTIGRMVGHFARLLESIVAQPDQSIEELPLLTTRERRQLTLQWNDTATAYPREKCVHHLFEDQVAQTPDVVAFVYEGQQLTYRGLNERANQLAHHLRELGVGPETLVGLCLDRSLEMVVGQLGIFKAGAAYVPFDAHYPQQRLAFLLEDTGLRFLLSQEDLLAKLPLTDGQTVICLDRDASRLSGYDSTNPLTKMHPQNLAYVIHTSGSTGRPKGVQISHRAVSNFLTSMKQEPGIAREDRLLAVTTLTFDISVLELLLPITVGASVEVVNREIAADSERLAKMLDRPNVTIMQATPSTWQMLLESGWVGNESLKVLCGGEALPPDLARELIPCCGSLWNMYGPTETTVWSSISLVNASDNLASIGRPIANTRVYVLDSKGNPVPAGVPGELYIGGEGLARGYLNRPELTAERFVASPFKDQSGGRLYRTGDSCRWLADGTLEFLGRLDHQVKLRGFRIELGEIEAVLNQHPSVRQSALTVWEPSSGDKRLVAYVTFDTSSTPPSLRELQAHLSQRLPNYMLPATIIKVANLPLTPTGKVNREALPPPKAELAIRETQFSSPPSNPQEQAVAAIYSKLLHVDHVGSQSDFFSLGGHSLKVIGLVRAIKEEFGIHLPLNIVFSHSTVRELTGAIEKIQRPAPTADAKPGECSVPLVCLNYGPSLASLLGSEYPVEILPSDKLVVSAVKRRESLEELARLLVCELRDQIPNGPYRLSGFGVHAVLVYEMAQQLLASGQEVSFLVLVDPSWPWVPGHGVLHHVRRQFAQVTDSPLYHQPAVIWRKFNTLRNRLLKKWLGKERIEERLSRLLLPYQPKPYYGPLAIVSVQTLGSRISCDHWKTLAHGTLVTCKLATRHQDMFRGQSLILVADQLRKWLMELNAKSNG